VQFSVSTAQFSVANHGTMFCNHSAKVGKKMIGLEEKQCDDKINR
jgi:hypothetical protein